MNRIAISLAVSLAFLIGASSFVAGSETADEETPKCDGEWCEVTIGGASSVICCPLGACPENGDDGCLES